MNEEGKLIDIIKDENDYMNRSKDTGIVNKETGSSIGIKRDGSIDISSSNSLQYKLNHESGAATEISMQSTTITNRKNIISDEITINKHKLNPALYELSDMRLYNINGRDFAIGNLMSYATVLVRAWEPNLKRYVLIRRNIKLPLFSQLLNTPDAPEQMSMDTSVPEDLEKLKKDGV